MRCHFRSRSVRLALVLPVTLGAGCAMDLRADDYTVREQKQFAVADGVTPVVELATFDGDIAVRGWDRPEVRVEVEKRGTSKAVVEAIRVETAQDGDRIRVEATAPEQGRWGSGLTGTSRHVNLLASVPKRCVLRARTSDGTLKLESLDGDLDVETNDGSIRGIALAGTVRVRSGDGSIKLDPVDGHVDADTSDGSIVLAGRLLGLVARSGDGGIDIRLDSGSAPDRDWDITTVDGGISLQLPEPFAARIDARTSDGVVRAARAFGVATDEEPSSTLQTTLGEGGHLIRIRTSGGSISLRRP